MKNEKQANAKIGFFPSTCSVSSEAWNLALSLASLLLTGNWDGFHKLAACEDASPRCLSLAYAIYCAEV